MYILNLKYLFFLVVGVNGASKITNINVPTCRNCVHFIPDRGSEFASGLSRCSKFGNKNIINDKITYEYADSCRNNENKCGNQGKEFELEENLYGKITRHKILNVLPYTLFLLPSFVMLIYNLFIK